MKYIITLIIFFNICSASQFQGIVQIHYDYKIDGKVEHKKSYKIYISSKNVGKYLGFENNSLWTFKFINTRTNTIMTASQVDGSFYRIMAGEVINNTIIGTWFAGGGLKGDFIIEK